MNGQSGFTLALGDISWMPYEKLYHWLLNVFARTGLRVKIIHQDAILESNEPIVYYSHSKPNRLRKQDIWLPAASKLTGGLVANIDGSYIWAPLINETNDPIAGAIDLLSLEFERRKQTNYIQDIYGRIPTGIAVPWKDRLLPLVECCADTIRARIERGLGTRFERVEPWGDTKAVVVMTHDVDGPSLLSGFALMRSMLLGLFRGNPGEATSLRHAFFAIATKGCDPYWNFDVWCALASSLRTSPTFFFYPGPASGVKRHARDPHYKLNGFSFKKKLSHQSFSQSEIGLHKSINSGTVETLSRERCLLESQFETSVKQHRAHYWAYDWGSTPAFWRVLSEAGFEIDMSLSPMEIGYRNATGAPFKTPEGLMVFPTLAMDAYFTKCFKRLSDEKVVLLLQRILSDAVQYRHCLVLDWHVRSAFNEGPYKEFLFPLTMLLMRIIEHDAIEIISASEAASRWESHLYNIDIARHES